MHPFQDSFLLLFYEISLGGRFAVAATPFHELERSFYKSTGAVLLAVGLLGLWGNSDFYLQSLSSDIHTAVFVAIALHLVFLVCFALYLWSLWGERVHFRARMFASALLTGLAGLVLSAHTFHQAPFWSLETFVYPLSFVLSAFLLGGVTVGMLIGHWYLIDTGQSLDPFIRIFKFFVVALGAQTVSLLLLTPLLQLFGTGETQLSLERLWPNHSLLLTMRFLVAQVAPLLLSYMIWRTLKIPHTMAATGLFYIAMLGVFVGEILGRQILALTSLPF